MQGTKSSILCIIEALNTHEGKICRHKHCSILLLLYAFFNAKIWYVNDITRILFFESFFSLLNCPCSYKVAKVLNTITKLFWQLHTICGILYCSNKLKKKNLYFVHHHRILFTIFNINSGVGNSGKPQIQGLAKSNVFWIFFWTQQLLKGLRSEEQTSINVDFSISTTGMVHPIFIAPFFHFPPLYPFLIIIHTTILNFIFQANSRA